MTKLVARVNAACALTSNERIFFNFMPQKLNFFSHLRDFHSRETLRKRIFNKNKY